MDVGAWLEGLGLARYASAFEENAIDREVLGDLTDADLRGLGVAALGHRKTVLQEAPAERTRATGADMVAREHEFAMLTARWRQAEEGAGQVVLITGEPGIGKSLLVDSMRAHTARDGATQIVFRCSAHLLLD